jgi:hypothetical protein
MNPPASAAQTRRAWGDLDTIHVENRYPNGTYVDARRDAANQVPFACMVIVSPRIPRVQRTDREAPIMQFQEQFALGTCPLTHPNPPSPFYSMEAE